MSKEKEFDVTIFVGLDFLLVAFLTGHTLLYTKLHWHPVFCILGGLLACVILVFIMSIKFIGILVQVGFSAFWALLITALLNRLFHFKDDPIWSWTILIIAFLVVLGGHLSTFLTRKPSDKYIYRELPLSENNPIQHEYKILELNQRLSNVQENIQHAAEESSHLYDQAMQILEDANEFSPILAELQFTVNTVISCIREKLNSYGEYLKRIANIQDPKELEWNIKEMENCFSSIHDKIQELTKSINDALTEKYAQSQTQQNGTNSYYDESLFSGCTDKESLTKRYHSLMKTFHPDTGNGDLEMTQKIQLTYEKLLKQMT